MHHSGSSIVRRALALALLSVGAARGGAQTPAEPQPSGGTVSGYFQVIWGDPRSQRGEEGRRVYALFGDDGRFTMLEMSDAQAAGFGGVAAMNGRRVSLLLGDAVAGEPSSAGSAPRLRVRAVQRVEAPAGLTRRTLRVEAMSAASSGGVSRLDAGAAVSSRPYVTVLCKFPDFPDSTPAPKSHFESLVSGAYPSVDHFWREGSEQRVNLAGSVVLGWYTLPQPRSYYVANNNANLARLADDCTGAADADVNFPSYAGINLQFNTVLDCCSWGGGFPVNRDGVSKVYPMTWEASWAAYQMGTWAHEVGHSFGLPHSSGPYGRTYDSRWDVMSSSSWYKPSGSAVSFGTHTVSYHKDLLGWVPAQRKFVATGSQSEVAIERSALPGANANYQLAVIPIPSAPEQFYTVEVRRRVGYDSPLPGDAVVISRVDPDRAEPSQVVDPDGNGNTNDGGAMWTVGETFLDRENDIRVTVDSAKADAFYVTIAMGRSLALGATGRRVSMAAASGATLADSVDVRLGGAAGWRAAGRAGWSAIKTGAGTGGGWLRWERRAAALGPGLYVDTIEVTSAGAAGSPARLLDTLEVLAPTALAAGLSAPGHADSAVAPAARADSVLVRPGGPGAATAAWSAAASASWITLTASSGAGPGVLRWSWSTAGLAPGLYVDTIRVTVAGAAGGPAPFVASLRVLPAPVASAGSPSHRVAEAEGGMAVADSTTLRFNDRWAAGAGWLASAKPGLSRRFIRVLTPTGVGDGVVRYTRDAGTLAVGTYVDTVFVQGALVPRQVLVVDTLDVVTASATLSLSVGSRRDTVVAGGLSQSMDSVEVYLTGTGARTLSWTTSTRRGYVTLMSKDAFSPIGGGTGSGRLRWMHKPAGLAPGTYVDTLTITAGSLTGRVLDTMVVVPVLTVALDESRTVVGRRTEVLVGVGGARAADSASLRVELAVSAGGAPTWSATKVRAWTTLEAAAGTGSGRLRWTRDPAALAVGTYVDTITVTASGPGGAVAQARVVDTLRVLPPLALAVDGPATRHVAALMGFAVGLRDSAALSFSGFGAEGAAWTASAQRPWLRLTTASGTGAGLVRWERTAGSIPEGTHVDTILVEATPAAGGEKLAVRIVDSFTVAAAPSATEAAEELLGTPRLSALVRQLVDQMGNGDGVYNLGDFLAFLDRTGAQVSAELMSKVMRGGDPAPGRARSATEQP
ncbi:MAG TPA: hypothetical protein VKA84_21575 [Gemmatimonadaceae bacterium]|nr:hypothetical protein [Gemmatimonadaceae bacterium]